MCEYLMSNYKDLGPQNIRSYSENFAQQFPLTKEEATVLLPYLLGKMTRSIMNSADRTVIGHYHDDRFNPRQLLFIALYGGLLMFAYDKLLDITDCAIYIDTVFLDQREASKIVRALWGWIIPLHAHYSASLMARASLEDVFYQHIYDFFPELFSLMLDVYPI